MRALGIPNNKNFFEVTQIKDALELWTSIQARRPPARPAQPGLRRPPPEHGLEAAGWLQQKHLRMLAMRTPCMHWR
jgi:hypothetical protein